MEKYFFSAQQITSNFPISNAKSIRVKEIGEKNLKKNVSSQNFGWSKMVRMDKNGYIA